MNTEGPLDICCNHGEGIEAKLDRVLKLLEEVHAARKTNFLPTDIETELRYPLDTTPDGYTNGGRAYWM